MKTIKMGMCVFIALDAFLMALAMAATGDFLDSKTLIWIGILSFMAGVAVALSYSIMEGNQLES